MGNDKRGANPSRHMRRRARAAWSGLRGFSIGLLLMMVSLAGCGGCGGCGGRPGAEKWGGMSEAEWRKQYNERQEAERKEEAEAKKALEAKKLADAQKKAEKQAAASAALVAKTKPAAHLASSSKDARSLPADLSLWKDDDLLWARRRGDPRLMTAVQQRIKRSNQTDADAQLLTRLVCVPTPSDTKGQESSSGDEAPIARAPTGLIGAIAAALGDNPAPGARQTLLGLLSGTLMVEDDRAASAAALKALVEHPSVENDEIVLRVLIAPAEVRLSGQAAATSEELRRNAVALIRPSASEQFRVALARRLVDPATPSDVRRLLGPIVHDLQPRNRGAHAILYQSDLTDPQVRITIERQLVIHSSRALSVLLNLPLTEPVGESNSQGDLDAARDLWSNELVACLEHRLAAIETLREDGQTILLAGTIPLDRLRGRLRRTLTRHWDDGPAALRSAGFATKILSEPGMMLALKSAAREAQRKEGTSKKTTVAASQDARGRQSSRAKPAANTQSAPGTQIASQWEKASEDFLKLVCQRCRGAWLARAKTSGDRGHTTPPSSILEALPFRPHSAGELTAAHHIDWSDSGAPRTSSIRLDGLQVAYVRIEQSARPANLLAYYRRQMRSCQEHRLTNGVWLDAFTTGSAENRKRSVDVLIALASPAAARPANEEQELTVEILVVEALDPGAADNPATPPAPVARTVATTLQNPR